MPFSCVRPYNKSSATAKERASSCVSDPNGEYSNRQTCVEACFIGGQRAAPKKKAAAPKRKPAAPKRKPAAPKTKAAAPKRKTAAPKRKPAAPKKKGDKSVPASYKTRPSPAVAAKDFPDRRKKGNDGRMYNSKSDKNGVYRWYKVAKAATRKPKK